MAHQGGRRIWQLADADDYVLTWLEMPNGDAGALEAQLLQEFVREYHHLPFGNRLPSGSRLGHALPDAQHVDPQRPQRR